MLPVYFFIISALFSIATQGTRPVISLYIYGMGASEAIIGAMVASYAFLPMLLAVRAGKWVDRYGARLMTLWGSVGMISSLGIAAVFPNLPVLFLSQLLIGISQLCILVSIQVAFGNLQGNRDRLIAVFSLSVSTGELIGPFMGGALYDKFDFSIAYYASFFIMIVVLCMVLFFARTSWMNGRASKPSTEGPAVVKEPTWKLLKSVNLRNAMIVSGLVLYSKDLFVAYFPVYATMLGISATRIGMMLSLMAGMAIVIRLAQFHLVRFFGRGTVLFATLLLSGLTYMTIPFTEWTLMLTGLCMLMGLGLGLGQPLSVVFAMNSSPEGRLGEVLGLRLTFNRASQFGAPILFGAIGSAVGVSPIFWASGAVLFLGAFITRTR